ncbi:MAG: hypothetical protein M3O15_12690 [Acidobacteriota bacterium]|nr:hypothetical protein [Acidobacteriota bacterium]
MTVKRSWIPCSALALLLMIGAAPMSAAAKTKCDMTFTFTEWAAIVKHARGSGTITCDNGQRAQVRLSSKGGGLTAGKYKIEGKGEFSQVGNINDLFGSYVGAEANAGAVKSGATTVLTKGDVSLAIAGKGAGWDVGISLGKFTITRR